MELEKKALEDVSKRDDIEVLACVVRFKDGTSQAITLFESDKRALLLGYTKLLETELLKELMISEQSTTMRYG